jgi:hypothetical protein
VTVLVPATMAHLPRGRGGMPVPWVAAWSSERWAAVRWDPVVNRIALFTGGRHGRGRPVFGVMNEPRQRAAVMRRRCGVCGGPIPLELYRFVGYLPAHDRLLDATVEHRGERHRVTGEPLCCRPCATWAATGCPGIAGGCSGLLRITKLLPIAQLVDPSRAPATHDGRFDGDDDPAERARLGRIARRHGGAVGYVKVAVVEAEEVAL